MTFESNIHKQIQYQAEDLTHKHIRHLLWVKLLEIANYREVGRVTIDWDSVDNIKNTVQNYLLHHDFTRQS